jgi:hypothetical protein
VEQETVATPLEVTGFAKYYRELSDSFIDITGAANSLKNQIQKGACIFEIGLGIGYFAEQFLEDGYVVSGIQPPPPDTMLAVLKRNHPSLIVAEKRIEDYTFDSQYDVIVCHSSVFLFTRIEDERYSGASSMDSPIFQSMIPKQIAVENIRKVLSALSATGRFFVNIHTNPRPSVEVGMSGDRLTYEMRRCVYDLDAQKVEKRNVIIYRGTETISDETHFCLRYGEFGQLIESLNGKVSLLEDGYWVVIENKG